MKKFLMMVVAALSVLIFAGCADKPQEVAQKWGEAIISGDLAGANEYSSPVTHPINEAIIRDFAENAEHKARFESNWQKLSSAEVAIDGDIAFIIIDGKAELALIRIDGKWKVHINIQRGEGDSGADAEVDAQAQADADSQKE